MTNVYTCARFITYSCVDVCECTNHIRSHDHPKQMLLIAIDHSFIYVCISEVLHVLVYTQ